MLKSRGTIRVLIKRDLKYNGKSRHISTLIFSLLYFGKEVGSGSFCLSDQLHIIHYKIIKVIGMASRNMTSYITLGNINVSANVKLDRVI